MYCTYIVGPYLYFYLIQIFFSDLFYHILHLFLSPSLPISIFPQTSSVMSPSTPPSSSVFPIQKRSGLPGLLTKYGISSKIKDLPLYSALTRPPNRWTRVPNADKSIRNSSFSPFQRSLKHKATQL